MSHGVARHAVTYPSQGLAVIDQDVVPPGTKEWETRVFQREHNVMTRAAIQ